MLPHLLNYVRPIAGLLLESAVLALALRHGLFRRLPVFTSYLAAVVLVEIIRWSVVSVSGFTSPQYRWAYWLTQASLMILRGLVVAEICREVFGKHLGVWRMCRVFLASVAAILCAYAAVAAWRNQDHLRTLITTADRGLELAILGTLVFAFLFARYYLIRIDRLVALISTGLVFYAAVQVVNSEFMFSWKSYFPSYSAIVVYSFAISMLIWLVAVWRPIPARAPSAVLLGEQTYGEMMPEVNLRLRQLNNRLLEILR